MPLWIILSIGAVAFSGSTKLLASGVEDAGQAVDAAGSGTLKLVVAGAIGYGAAKYFKVI